MKIKKMPLLLRNTLILFLYISLSACGGGGSDTGGADDQGEQDEDVKESLVLVVGDSMSTGFGLATPWPGRLEDIINIPVDNSNSADGEPASFGLTYIQDELTSLNPSHVIIFLGTNDALRGSASEALADLQEMVNIANSQNVSVIIATLPVITLSSEQNSRAAQISNGIRDFSGVEVADLRAALGDGSNTIADGIHPNNNGQQIIANTMAEFF